MEGSSRNFTASEVIEMCGVDDEFEESDDDFTPCGDFTDVDNSETLFPSELLAPSSMPFLTFTQENRQPACRDSLLNNDADCIAEGNRRCKNVLFCDLAIVLEILESETDSEIDHSDDDSTGKLFL